MPSNFPMARARRLRRTAALRDLVRENSLVPADLIWPIFICEGRGISEGVSSMPGVARMSVDRAIEALRHAFDLGITTAALFPYVEREKKSSNCEEAWNPDNLVNRATRQIKSALPDMAVLVDVALDPYNADGHDGLLRNGEILNDETVECLVKEAISHAEAGADILGPSDMMDGRIGAIRKSLENHKFQNTAIMSYSAKYASAFYGPFRNAVGSGELLRGDKKSYQMDPGNSIEALRMVQRDIAEGADIVMVKPGMPYLDICRLVASSVSVPTFAYQVSGEYSMLQASSLNGWIELDAAVAESLLSFKRAGCRGILTYFAVYAAEKILKNN
ncbi:MAG: porphobilinogen synthase [Albidovulum sp.]|nr:porphobilinogen synthase [Albidovulum sp.]